MAVTRVCLYTRISTDEESQPTSLHSQRERLEAFCTAQEGWRIIAHQEDRATGTKLDRPGLQAALDLARSGSIDLLLVYRVDRLSRKVRQLAQLAEELDTYGVTLRSATEPFDTGSAAGRMMLQMLAVFAELEHATIVDRVTAGIERRAKEGRWPTGRLPFGYRRDQHKHVVPDPRTAPVVKRIFDLYTRGRLGTAAIARTLAAEQAPAPPAGWQPAVVQLILDNEAYLGRVIWRRQSLPGLHAPLIDDVTFHRARMLLRERGEDMALRRTNASDYLLSGLLRCGRCRRAYVGMSARGNGGTYHYSPAPAGRSSAARAATASASLATSLKAPCSSSSVRSTATARSSAEPSTRLPSSSRPTVHSSKTAGVPSPKRSVAPSEPSTATTTPSKAATSTSAASKRACTPSRRASTPSASKTPSSPNTSPQRSIRRPTEPTSRRSPTSSSAPSPRQTRGRRKPSSDY
jgi:DNA invertase Pin-like site-specific DNA recombinase